MPIVTITVLSILVIIICWIIVIYNKLVKLKILVEEAWSIVDVFLTKRYDLIPNLVNIVKGYAIHEKEIIENVAIARSRAIAAKNIDDKIESESVLEGTLDRLLIISENYPQLRASENFIHLQVELSSLEGELEKARRYYNGTVREKNICISSFPSNIVAAIFSFSKGTFFGAEERAREVPEASFSE